MELVLHMLRVRRDELQPQGVRLCHLPRKNPRTEYELGKKLGEGGQGAVYIAKKRDTGEPRVVKFYSKAAAAMPLDDIKDEFELLKSLDHPNIARIYEAFEDASNAYVVSEPLFGGDLTTLLTKAKENGVTPTYAWVGGVYRQVVGALIYLHSKRVIHCDMKEANVMIAGDSHWQSPKVVVIDFGLAKGFHDAAQTCGTPGYMPPEVWTNQLWTPKGDMHALAMMLIQTFTGQLPFLGRSMEEIQHKTLHMPVDVSRLP